MSHHTNNRGTTRFRETKVPVIYALICNVCSRPRSTQGMLPCGADTTRHFYHFARTVYQYGRPHRLCCVSSRSIWGKVDACPDMGQLLAKSMHVGSEIEFTYVTFRLLPSTVISFMFSSHEMLFVERMQYPIRKTNYVTLIDSVRVLLEQCRRGRTINGKISNKI